MVGRARCLYILCMSLNIFCMRPGKLCMPQHHRLLKLGICSETRNSWVDWWEAAVGWHNCASTGNRQQAGWPEVQIRAGQAATSPSMSAKALDLSTSHPNPRALHAGQRGLWAAASPVGCYNALLGPMQTADTCSLGRPACDSQPMLYARFCYHSKNGFSQHFQLTPVQIVYK